MAIATTQLTGVSHLKKIVLISAIVVVASSAYIFNQQNSSATYNVLDYVPADTPIFAAQLEPFPLKDYIKSGPNVVDPSEQQTLDEFDAPTNPGEKFLLSLMKTYQSNLSNADLFTKTFGLPDDVRAYFYTLGLLPVFKIEIADAQAIWSLLDKTEHETGFQHKKGTLQHIQYRAYPITDVTDPVNAEIIVAIDNGLLTVTVNSAYSDDAQLANALGLTKAENSLADSKVIQEIVKKHNFKDASIAFINHMELIKGLTTQDGNQLAKQISIIDKNLGSDNPISQIRNEQCAAELATIAQNWPRTVAGYTQLDITSKQSTIAVSAIVESKNKTILTALSTLRGFIPQYTQDINANVFAMGLGFDVSNLANTLNNIWSDLQTPSYTCQPLADIQYQISQSDNSISMLGMGANMVSGLQGISIGLLDYTVSKMGASTQLDSLDALITISSENPEQLFNYVKMFVPELQNIQLTSDGEAIELNSILPIVNELKLNIAPKLAIRGKHLVIYNGDKGKKAADALASQALDKNGLYTLSFDFKKMLTPIITATELSGETIPEEMMFLTEYDARMQMSFDVNQQGLIFKSKINNKAPQE